MNLIIDFYLITSIATVGKIIIRKWSIRLVFSTLSLVQESLGHSGKACITIRGSTYKSLYWNTYHKCACRMTNLKGMSNKQR